MPINRVISTVMISVQNLRSPHVVKLSPSEGWLKRVAADLAPSNPAAATIDGELTLRLNNAGIVHVSGSLSALAVQPCSRCGDPITLPLSAQIKATFRPPYGVDGPKDLSLTTEDLDVYFFEDGVINLETLVNDTLQCAIPYQFTCESAGHRACDNAHLASEGDKAGSRSGANSPFAILKTIK